MGLTKGWVFGGAIDGSGDVVGSSVVGEVDGGRHRGVSGTFNRSLGWYYLISMTRICKKMRIHELIKVSYKSKTFIF